MSRASYRAGDLLRIRQERWRVVAAVAHDDHVLLDVRGCDASNSQTSALFLSAVERIERLPQSRRPRLVRPARWRAIVRDELAAASPRFDALRAASRASLSILPFQLEPALAVTHGIGCRLLLADDVGLGKTVQAGLVVAEVLARMPEGRALIVAPAALRHQWREELETRFALAVRIIDTAAIARGDAQSPADGNPWSASQVAVASIDYVKRPEVLRALEALVWDVVVFDEAHALSGPSDRAAAASQLAARAHTVVTLTATPHSGDDDAFERLCGLGQLRPSPVLLFRRTRLAIGLAATRRTKWLRVRLRDPELAMHRAVLQYARRVCRQRSGRNTPARLAMTVLLKRAWSSPASLKASVERRLALLDDIESPNGLDQLALPFGDVSDEVPFSLLATPGLDDRAEERRLLEDILALASRAAGEDRKLQVLHRLISRCHEPTIVFTEYRDTLEHILSSLRPATAVSVHGGMTAIERHAALRQFTHGAAHLLLATDAVSEGLNLHHRSCRVINVELPWTPVRLEQRIGRVDRIGQRRTVHAVHLVAGGTAEEDIVARLLKRAAIADRVLLEGESDAGEAPEIAAAIFGQAQEETPAAARAAASLFVRPDLRAIAVEEASRLNAIRALRGDASRSQPGARPVVTRISHRTGRHCLCALRLRLVDDRGRDALDEMIGVRGLPEETMLAAMKDACSSPHLLLSAHASIEQEALHTIQAARLFSDEAMARYSDIRDALLRRRARLVVPYEAGLFDRRADRITAARARIFDDAMRRCERTRSTLERLQHLSLQSCDLVFAVVLG